MRIKINFSFVELMFVLCACIVAATLFSKPEIVSLLFYISFIVLLVKFIQCFNLNDRTLFLLMALLVLALSNVLINAAINNSDLSFGYLKKFLMYAATLIFLYVISLISIDERIFRSTVKISIGIGLLFLIAYFEFDIRTLTGRLLTMNFSNPNLLAMWLFIIIMYTVVAQFCVLSWAWHVLLVAETIALLYLVLLTESRTAIFCAAAFVLQWILLKLGVKKFYTKKSLTAFVLIFPLVFVAIYFLFINPLSEFFSFLVSEGKGFDSRYDIWEDALRWFAQHPLIGSYYEASEGTGEFQLHNTLLDTLCSYGAVVTVMMLVYVYRILRRIIGDVKNTRQVLCLIGFFVAWMYGTGEAALLSGGLGIYIIECSFLLLARYDDESLFSKTRVAVK